MGRRKKGTNQRGGGKGDKLNGRDKEKVATFLGKTRSDGGWKREAQRIAN